MIVAPLIFQGYVQTDGKTPLHDSTALDYHGLTFSKSISMKQTSMQKIWMNCPLLKKLWWLEIYVWYKDPNEMLSYVASLTIRIYINTLLYVFVDLCIFNSILFEKKFHRPIFVNIFQRSFVTIITKKGCFQVWL